MVIFDGEATKKHHKLELKCFFKYFSPVKNISVSVKLGFLMGLVRYPGTEQQNTYKVDDIHTAKLRGT